MEPRQEAKPLTIAHTAWWAPQWARLSFPNTIPAAVGAAPWAAALPGSPVLTCLSLLCGLDGISLRAAKPRALVVLGCAGISPRRSWQGCTLESVRLLCCRWAARWTGLGTVGRGPLQLPPSGLFSCDKNRPSHSAPLQEVCSRRPVSHLPPLSLQAGEVAAPGSAEEGVTQEQAPLVTLFLAGPRRLWRDPPAKRLQGGKPKSSSSGLVWFGLVCLVSPSLQQAVCKQANHPHYKSFICCLSPPFCQRVCPLHCCAGPHKQLIQHPAWEGKRWEPRSRPRLTQKDSAGKNSFSPLPELPSKRISPQSGSSASPDAPSCLLCTAEQQINIPIPPQVGSQEKPQRGEGRSGQKWTSSNDNKRIHGFKQPKRNWK